MHFFSQSILHSHNRALTSHPLRYTQFVESIDFAPRSLKFSFDGAEKTMMIDSTTARSLELVYSLKDLKSPNTLFGLLNRTSTR